MEKLTYVLLVMLLLLGGLALSSQKGPYPDLVYFNVRMSEDIALKDTAEGLTDIFMWGLSGPQIFGLDQATRDKLDLYAVPSGSWSLLMNPIPNKAPYVVEVGGKEYFNAFAIKDIRFAMNDLINRQYLVDEILGGAGTPAFTMATTGQPGTYRYNLLATKFGLTAEGNEARALEVIESSMQAAAALPENVGRLEKKDDGFWYFDNEPVTIKIAIRVDDPQGRLKEGDYIGDQLEKAGLKAERMYWDRIKCSNVVYGGDPAEFAYQMYTEGWGAGATRAFWEHIVAQMYAPWYGYMPGGMTEGFWNYEQDEIDEVTLKAYTGNFLTEEEYWELALRGLELGLEEAVRIYVVNQLDFFVANESRLKQRFAYGLGDGLNTWSIRTAVTDDRTLFITQFSAMGSLFMDAWDPIGTDGFDSVYSNYIAENLYDSAMFESPASAIPTPLRAVPVDVQTKARRNEEGDVVGDYEVPASAINYCPFNEAWLEVGEGNKSISMATYEFKFGKLHHGQPITVVDFLYAQAFQMEWANKESDDDLQYEQAYSSSLQSGLDTIIGWVLNEDNTITVYFNYNFPASKDRVASWGAPGISVSSSGHPVGCAWEIAEAMSLLVTEGSKSGTAYSITMDPAFTEVDAIAPACVKDIRAKLVEMKEKKHIPNYIKEFVDEEYVLGRYESAIEFIDDYGHAYISNGPFYLSKFDSTSNYMELRAFRDPDYPYEDTYWIEELKAIRMEIDSLETPAFVAKGSDLPVSVYVSEVTYPIDEAVPATTGKVTLSLIFGQETREFEAAMTEAGLFECVIPASAIEDLDPGSYDIMAIAELEGAIPASASTSIVIY
ncbi:ABC transporter substrate-binding protein [Mesotoga sp.]|uniref:ABC transporter substrate-binding protein n=1 Tax=Mesotoga sp. TaxID=2053577 RepID=UPI003562CD7B